MLRRLLLTSLLALGLAPAGAHAAEFRPDIDMRAPSGLQLTTDGGGRSFVAFESRVDNVGPGVLKLLGERPDTSGDTMSVTQVLLNSNSVTSGTVERAVPGAGTMQFSPAGGHNHWHYLRFEDYMLLSVPDLSFVAPTRKTGFCLSGLRLAFSCGANGPDRLQIGDPAEANPGALPSPQTQAMGLIAQGGPDAAGNRSTFDIYDPSVEGQDIEITNVPNGRYCLSFVANPEERIVEGSTQNNGASRLVDVGGDLGARTLDVGAAFEDSGTCGLTDPPGPDAPGGPGLGSPGPGTVPSPISTNPLRSAPLLTMRKAAQLTRSALSQKFRKPTRLSRSCRLTAVQHATCRVAFRQSGALYRGVVGVKQARKAGEWRWFYALDVKRTRKAGCRACPARVRTKTLLGGVLGANDAAARRLLRLPAGRPAPTRRGTAWADSRLCRLSRAQVAERRPVG